MTELHENTFILQVPITLRIAVKSDIKKLEWFGQYTHFRNVLRRAYREQVRERRILLVADYNGFPIGQVFIQLSSVNPLIADGQQRAYLYSFRVMEMFRGQGIGTRLLLGAEAMLYQQGFRSTTISVAKDNLAALRLYQRHGYEIFEQDAGEWSYIDHTGNIRYVKEPCWVMEKLLAKPE